MQNRVLADYDLPKDIEEELKEDAYLKTYEEFAKVVSTAFITVAVAGLILVVTWKLELYGITITEICILWLHLPSWYYTFTRKPKRDDIKTYERNIKWFLKNDERYKGYVECSENSDNNDLYRQDEESNQIML